MLNQWCEKEVVIQRILLYSYHTKAYANKDYNISGNLKQSKNAVREIEMGYEDAAFKKGIKFIKSINIFEIIFNLFDFINSTS